MGKPIVNRVLPSDYTHEKRCKKFRELESRVTKTESGCWLMPGVWMSTGYACISLRRNGKRSQWPAHRFMWALIHGEIPDGLFICHTCDVRPCVRPEHLFLGTAAENMADASRKDRWADARRRRGTTPKPLKPKRGLIWHEGRQITIRELSVESGVPYNRLHQRYHYCHLRGAALVSPGRLPRGRRIGWRKYTAQLAASTSTAPPEHP
jgi:hypothetical protein